MKLNVGDYVRTECGIAKIKNFETKNKEVIELDKDIMICNMDCYRNCCTINQVIKSSPNIIDLIEVDDYVNGLPVERIKGTLDDKNDIRVWFGVATYGKTALNQINHRYTVKDELEDDYSLRFRCIKPDDIKSIITREQFEEMKYEIK